MKIYSIKIESCKFKLAYYREYYDGWNNSLFIGFVVISWMDTGRKSDFM